MKEGSDERNKETKTKRKKERKKERIKDIEKNRKYRIKQTNKQVSKQTNKQTNKQTKHERMNEGSDERKKEWKKKKERQTDRQTDRLTDRTDKKYQASFVICLTFSRLCVIQIVSAITHTIRQKNHTGRQWHSGCSTDDINRPPACNLSLMHAPRLMFRFMFGLRSHRGAGIAHW